MLTDGERKSIWRACKCIENEYFCQEYGRAIEAAVLAKQGWQPIETSPKTSKTILIHCAERKNTYTVTWWRDDEFPWSGKWKHFAGGFLDEVPTHWMPLPAPPTGEQT